MLLLIEEAKTQREELRHQIQEVRSAVVSNLALEQDAETTLDNNLKLHIQELSQTLTRVKLNKFRRDEQDYKRVQSTPGRNALVRRQDVHGLYLLAYLAAPPLAKTMNLSLKSAVLF
ncbi:hypothetical protein WMY93_005654 [Mugilogobius chulae]|uniref:Uncharacterized protein n=1 Tax=Mugilogobius chulae TaxID=88201 RepID=A0AAW0PT96_9GOBI